MSTVKSVFISYSSRDREEAIAVKELLETHDYKVWLDYFDIIPSHSLKNILLENIKKADVICLLLSPSSVESNWVKQEMEYAEQEQKNREITILPLIVRPCKIPDYVKSTLGIDIMDGLNTAEVQQRFIRYFYGATGRTDSGVTEELLLDARRKQLLENESYKIAADKIFPTLYKNDVSPFLSNAIREINITVDPNTFLGERKVIYELLIHLDDLFTSPMSFYFAKYEEGNTWPEEFNFQELPYTEYFEYNNARMEVIFKWYDRVETLSQMIDGTDLNELPPTYSLEFDGKDFKINLGGTKVYEMPSLQSMKDKQSTMQLIAHYPDAKTAEEIDLSLTDIDIALTAVYQGDRNQFLTIFKSKHLGLEKILLESPYLKSIPSLLEKEALLQMYTPLIDKKREITENKQRRAMDLCNAPMESLDDYDKRMVANLTMNEAKLHVIRAQDQEALTKFFKVYRLLDSFIFDKNKFPTYDDSYLAFHAIRNIADYMITHNDLEQGPKYCELLFDIANQLHSNNPQEADFTRFLGSAYWYNAHAALLMGEQKDAVLCLEESVKCYETLYTKIPNNTRLEDLVRAKEKVVALIESRKIPSHLPLKKWKKEIGLTPEKEKVWQKKLETRFVPEWFSLQNDPNWPVIPVSSNLLRYTANIRKGWASSPTVESTGIETIHMYRGPNITNNFIVSVWDNSPTNGRMCDWVDGAFALINSPDPFLFAGGKDKPGFMEWNYLGSFSEISNQLKVDEAHVYEGVARIVDKYPLLSRIYLLLARKGNFAWKVILSIESACIPGMPYQTIYTNDHIRACATFGSLKLL